MRWHFLIRSEWAILRTINQPQIEFPKLHAHFQLNVDESCFVCNDGILKIIGDKEKKYHDKNVSDSRVSITVVRTGSAAGGHGPVIFVVTGTTINCNFSSKRLIDEYGLPEGSIVLCNENAYMDDVTWVLTVKHLSAGIQKIVVICDHLEWWTPIIFDGFKSNVNEHESLRT